MQQYNDPNDPRLKREKDQQALNTTDAGAGQGREGGDDSLADASPTEARADEKVIVNEQANNQIVNRPSQSEIDSSYQDVVNE
jgi:hypothetical protein